MMAGAQHQVDQVIFRWAETTLTGNRGVGPVASTMDPMGVDLWRTRLDSEIWAATRPGLSYLEANGADVVIHKMPVRDNNDRPGSTLTHVLIGPTGSIGAQRALGLADWEGWIRDGNRAPVDGRLPMLSCDEIVGAADLGVQSLRLRARRVPPGPIEQLARTLLADPTAVLSIMADDLPVPEVLCGLVDLLGPAYGPWTFATAESADEGPMRPRLIFLDHVPDGLAPRRRLSLTRSPSTETDSEGFLAFYTDAYRRDGLRAIHPVRPRTVFAKPKEVRAWERGSLAAPGVLKSPHSLLHRVGSGDLSDAEIRYVAAPRTIDELAGLIPGLSTAHLTALLRDWREGHAAERWPSLVDPAVDEALHRIVTSPDDSQALIAATAAMMPPPAEIHRAVEHRLAVLDGRPPADQRSARLALLGRVVGLRASITADDPTVALIAGGLSTVTLVEEVSAAGPAAEKMVDILLVLLGRRHAAGSDARAVYDAMQRHRLLVPVLQRSAKPDQVMRRLHYLLSTLFGPGVGDASVIRFLLGSFGSTVPVAVLGALRQLADSDKSVRQIDEIGMRQLLSAEGIDALADPPVRQKSIPPAAATPPTPPVRIERPPTVAAEPPFDHRDVWVLLGIVGVFAAVMAVMALSLAM